jgi:hypothetical protein
VRDDLFVEGVVRLHLQPDETLVVKVPSQHIVPAGDRLKEIHKQAGWKFKLLVLPKEFDLEVISEPSDV